jgi:hypothetical protein
LDKEISKPPMKLMAERFAFEAYYILIGLVCRSLSITSSDTLLEFIEAPRVLGYSCLTEDRIKGLQKVEMARLRRAKRHQYFFHYHLFSLKNYRKRDSNPWEDAPNVTLVIYRS